MSGHWDQGGLTAIAFVAGGLTSMACGLIGMKVAVFSNARTTVVAAGNNAWTEVGPAVQDDNIRLNPRL